ncbi:MAG: HEAT repeat domain-containing protein, partial [Planctomycetota bacterium]|nr:HEAT repeat domain-containing protein [Planctomycetota bacterium]
MRRLFPVLFLAATALAQDAGEIAKRLADADPAIRRAAAEQLGALGHAAGSAALPLAYAAYDEDGRVHLAAVAALGRIGPEARAAVSFLEELAAANRGYAARLRDALDRIGRPASPAAPALVVWLQKKKKLPKSATRLEDIPAKQLASVLIALNQKDERLLGQAAYVLSRVAPAKPNVVTALAPLLAHGSAYVRRHTMFALLRGGATALDVLEKELKALPVRRRRHAAGALAEMGRGAVRALPALTAALEDEDSYVRLSAVRAIGNMRAAGAPAVPALALMLPGADRNLAGALTSALFLIGRAAAPATPALAELLGSSDPYLRGMACQALEAFGPDAKAAVPALVQACYDEVWTVTHGALRALRRIGPAAGEAAPFLAELAEAFPFASGAVAPVLQALKQGTPLPPNPAASDLPALRERLAAADAVAAGRAAFSIGRLKADDETTLSALGRALAHDVPYVRRHASLALLRIGAASIPTLLAAMKQDRVATRRLVADVLAHAASPATKEMLPVLIEALDDEDLDVRYRACSALGVIGDRTAIPSLIARVREDEAQVVGTAVWALGRIGPAAAVAIRSMTEALARHDDQGMAWSILTAFGEFGLAAEPAIPTIVATGLRPRTSLIGP